MFDLVAITETESCTGAPHTFYPYNDASPTRIDHILLDPALVQTVVSCCVISDAPLNVSRHLPVFVHLSINIHPTSQLTSSMFCRTIYKFNKSHALTDYKTTLTGLLKDNPLMTKTLLLPMPQYRFTVDQCLSRCRYKTFLKLY